MAKWLKNGSPESGQKAYGGTNAAAFASHSLLQEMNQVAEEKLKYLREDGDALFAGLCCTAELWRIRDYINKSTYADKVDFNRQP